MTLATFKTSVSAAIRRGTSQDANIPRWVRLAARWLEQNYDFNYMRRIGEVINLNPAAMNPEVIDLPNDRVKSIEMLRTVWNDGGTARYGKPLIQVEPYEVTATDQGAPNGYYQVGDQLILDARVTVPTSLAIIYYEFTDWPTADVANPSLLRKYESLLLARTMMDVWLELKDVAALTTWSEKFQLELKTALTMEEEARQRNTDHRMLYGQ